MKVDLDDFNKDLQVSALLCNAPSHLAASVNLYHSELSRTNIRPLKQNLLLKEQVVMVFIGTGCFQASAQSLGAQV